MNLNEKIIIFLNLWTILNKIGGEKFNNNVKFHRLILERNLRNFFFYKMPTDN